MKELAIKGASGLGDAIYLYPIVEYYSKKYDKIHVMSDYPELFETIPNATCFRHLKLNYIPVRERNNVRKVPITIRATYGPGKHKKGTSQFEDYYVFAGIKTKIELRIPWNIRNTELTNIVKNIAKERKICIASTPYEPFGRDDEWGAVLRIKPEIIQAIVCKYRKEILFISTGNKFCLHRTSCEYDLVDQTTVSDLMDIVSVSDICLSQIGNMLPMAECQGKKNLW